jgi:cupin 2 domain-containing protein
MVEPGNLFAGIPDCLPDELVQTLWHSGPLRLERIVSFGQSSPPEFWYDSDADEWVVLLAGAARLRIEGRDDLIELGPGDYLLLPARTRHRVEWTTPDQPTVWLAVHHQSG